MSKTIETSKYEFSHGRRPKGYGYWGFLLDGKLFWIGSMNYGDACKALRKTDEFKAANRVEVAT